MLISGAPVPVDLEDLKRNTNYSGGYNEEHPCIQSFWRAVEDFNDTQKRQLLKFVTSCSRPPLLGFKVGAMRDTASGFCISGKQYGEILVVLVVPYLTVSVTTRCHWMNHWKAMGDGQWKLFYCYSMLYRVRTVGFPFI